MDDSPVQETQNVSNNNNDTEEIDPLDAYMLEIDEQVQKLDEKDKLKEAEELAARKRVESLKEAESAAVNDENEDEEEEETIGKAGNFSTVEELIA